MGNHHSLVDRFFNGQCSLDYPCDHLDVQVQPNDIQGIWVQRATSEKFDNPQCKFRVYNFKKKAISQTELSAVNVCYNKDATSFSVSGVVEILKPFKGQILLVFPEFNELFYQGVKRMNTTFCIYEFNSDILLLKDSSTTDQFILLARNTEISIENYKTQYNLKDSDMSVDKSVQELLKPDIFQTEQRYLFDVRHERAKEFPKWNSKKYELGLFCAQHLLNLEIILKGKTEQQKQKDIVVDIKNSNMQFIDFIHYKVIGQNPSEIASIAANNNDPKMGFIFIRGTAKPQEWIQNVKYSEIEFDNYFGSKLAKFVSNPKFNQELLSNVKIHRGFSEITIPLIKQLFESNINIGQFDKILISGHSLGAALASLIAVILKLVYPKKEIKVITFGKPRVGNDKYAHLVKTIFNIEKDFTVFNHTSDIVGNMPLKTTRDLLGPKEYYFADDGNVIKIDKDYGTIWWNHTLPGYIQSLQKMKFE